jgi:hypothetical protein
MFEKWGEKTLLLVGEAMSSSAGIRDRVRTDVVEPRLYNDATDTSNSAYVWRKAANICEAIAMFLMVVQAVLAFGAATYDMRNLSFVAGGVNVLSAGLLAYARYCSNESRERLTELNMLLKYMDLPEIPVIAVDNTRVAAPGEYAVSMSPVQSVVDAISPNNASLQQQMNQRVTDAERALHSTVDATTSAINTATQVAIPAAGSALATAISNATNLSVRIHDVSDSGTALD